MASTTHSEIYTNAVPQSRLDVLVESDKAEDMEKFTVVVQGVVYPCQVSVQALYAVSDTADLHANQVEAFFRLKQAIQGTVEKRVNEKTVACPVVLKVEDILAYYQSGNRAAIAKLTPDRPLFGQGEGKNTIARLSRTGFHRKDYRYSAH